MEFTGKRRVKMIGKSVQVKQMAFMKLLIKTLCLSFFSSKTIATTSTTSGCVPSGYLPVYVGWNRVRFLIPTRFLNFPIFMFLLDKAYEEFGFKFSGGIVLPCEVEFFKKLFKLLRKDEKKYASSMVDEILKILVSDHDLDQVGFGSSVSVFKKEHHCYASCPSHHSYLEASIGES